MSRFWLGAILAFLVLGFVACGGGGGDEEVATPESIGQPASPAAGTPADGFSITDSLFESETNGYQVHFPEGWTPRPNFLPVATLSIDAFFAPDIVQEVQPNIAVACEQLPEETDLKAYFDAKMQVVKQVTQTEPEVTSGEVSGQEAMVASYKREKIEAPIEKTEVFFRTDRCGWSVSLTVPLARAADYEGLFEDFLSSFRLLP